MRIMIAVALYLLGSLFPTMARDIVPDSTRDCQSRLGALGSLIRKHNPTEDHMVKLRNKARRVNRLCQDEDFKRAHRIIQRMKREIQAVNNPARDFEAEQNTSKGKIKKCLDKLHDLGPKVRKAHLDAENMRVIKSMGKRMHQNCRLQRFSRAQRDHRKILRTLAKITARRDATAENFTTMRGCQNKVASLNKRVRRQKLSRQIRVWMRKSQQQILSLCKNKKFKKAEREFKNTENDFAKYLRDAEKPVVAQASNRNDMRNCRRSYTFMFQLINSKEMSRRQRKNLLTKRKQLGSYCYEKDFDSAKTLFKEMRSDLARLKNNDARPKALPYVRLTARNCNRKIDDLQAQADNMDLTSRDINGLAGGRKRIQAYCDKKDYRRATRWYQRVQKRMAQLKKDLHRVSLQDRPARNTRPNRRGRDQNNDRFETVDTKEACLDKHRGLVRKIADDAPSFRIKAKLRGKAIYMRLQCQRRKFSKAMRIHDRALQELK